MERAPHEVKAAAVLRELADTRHRGDFEVAEMAGQDEESLAFSNDVERRFNVFHTNPGLAPFLRHQWEPDEFDEEAEVMGIVSLRDATDFVFGQHIAKETPKVVENDPAPIRKQVVEQFSKPRHPDLYQVSPGDGRGRNFGVSERDADADPVAINNGLGVHTGFHAGRAVSVAFHREISESNQAQRRLTRK